MKLYLKILSNDWIEATWSEDDKQVHCESFSGHPEHIAMLRVKITEYGVDTTTDDELMIAECIANFKMPTDEELLVEANKAKVQEARAYLISTAWYIERLNDPSSGKAVPQEVIDKRAGARALINELEG